MEQVSIEAYSSAGSFRVSVIWQCWRAKRKVKRSFFHGDFQPVVFIPGFCSMKVPFSSTVDHQAHFKQLPHLQPQQVHGFLGFSSWNPSAIE